MTAAVSELAPAKLNLYLHIVGRRNDGYHLLDSLVVFTELADEIVVGDSDALTLDIDGPFAPHLRAAIIADARPDLVVRAASQLAKALGTRRGAHFRLTKNLPVAGGIGGGSADAAAALRALTRLWSVDLSAKALATIALGLGADVPVCLELAPMRMQGIGDLLVPWANLPGAGVLLVNPGIGLSTAAVFGARTGPYSAPDHLAGLAPGSAAADLAGLVSSRRNDLTAAAVALQPVIADVLEALARSDGCLLARLSGSGPTCFGIFADEPAARTAAAALSRAYPAWWVAPTVLLPGGGPAVATRTANA